MDLQGIGVSVIEASVTKLAREVMHVQLRRVRPLPCQGHASARSLRIYGRSICFCILQSCLVLAGHTSIDKCPVLLQVHADYRLSASNQSMRFALTDMQVDNQLLTSSQPVVLARARAKCACL